MAAFNLAIDGSIINLAVLPLPAAVLIAIAGSYQSWRCRQPFLWPLTAAFNLRLAVDGSI
jgi:hypothetical protein